MIKNLKILTKQKATMSCLPEISIITINYNGLLDTIELCNSLEKYVMSITYELIVVDNGSQKNEAAELHSLFPWITPIRSEINLGFSGGNNLGICHARGKYILLLNNDTYICDDTLCHLKESLANNSQMAAVSPKIRFAFPPQHIQFAGYTPLTKITLRNNSIGFNEPDKGQYDIPNKTPIVHGAAMMLKREVIDKVGFMPEIYFLYYEELDWCTKMTDAGYILGYEPRCTVFHKESQSTGQLSPLRTFFLTRNRLLFAWRNRKGYEKWLALIYQYLIAIPVHCIRLCLQKRIDLALSIIRGAIAFTILKNKKK